MGNRLKNKNVPDSIIFMLLGVSLLIYALVGHSAGLAVEWKLSPYLFPALIAVFLVLLSVSLFFDGKKEGESASEREAAPAETVLWKRAAVTLLAAFAYFALMPVLRFIPSTVLFLSGLTCYLGERRRYVIALVSVITSFVFYGIFAVAFHVMLP